MPTLAQAFVDIIGRDVGLTKALGKAQSDTEKAAEKMEARIRKMGEGFKTIGSAMSIGITAPIVAALGMAVKGAIEDEAVTARLAASLQATGDYSEATAKRLEAFAMQMQRQTVYIHDDTLAQMAYGHNLGITTDKLEQAARAAAGLAAKYKIDLSSAMMLIGRASQGNTVMLRRYGIVLDENLTPQEKFNALLTLGTKAFSLAEAEAKTAGGQLKQLKNEVATLSDEFGEVLLPAVGRVVGSVRTMVDTFRNLTDSQKKSIVTIALVAAAIGPLLIVVGQLIISVQSLATAFVFLSANPIVATIAGVTALTAAIWLSVGAHKALEEASKRKYSGKPGVDTSDIGAMTTRAAKLRREIASLEQKERTLIPQERIPILGRRAHEMRMYGQGKRLEKQAELADIEKALKTAKSARDLAARTVIDEAAAADKAAIETIRREIAKRGMSEIQALQADKTAAMDAAGTPGLKAATAADFDDRIARARIRIAQEGQAKLAQAEAASAAASQTKRDAAKRADITARRSAWEQVASMSEEFTVRMVTLAQGEAAGKLKAIQFEATKRREAILANVKDEERRAMLLKALSADVAAQNSAVMDEETKRKNDDAKAEVERKRAKIGFLGGGAGEVWRGAMAAGARLSVPDAPEVKTEKAQLDQLKNIAEWTEKQYLFAVNNVNKLATAESML